jgi:16S rRNA (adenine1518-N6/adenine1519-N6)-dimethyltransferase
MKRYGFSFDKSLGQNFLIDDAVPAAIAESAGLDEDTCVLEIGPGIGTLTYELCLRAKKVLAVELDKRLAPVLSETMGQFDNFALHLGDALKVDLAALCREHFGDAPFVVCANLPYYITTPIIMHLLESGLPARQITVMIQREVAARFDAAPGSPDYGAVTVSADYYAQTARHFDVPPEAFMPAPKVTSTVISFSPIAPPVTPQNTEKMFRIIKAAFAQRRKTLINTVSNTMGINKEILKEALTKADLPLTARGEELTMEQLCSLANVLTKKE